MRYCCFCRKQATSRISLSSASCARKTLDMHKNTQNMHTDNTRTQHTHCIKIGSTFIASGTSSGLGDHVYSLSESCEPLSSWFPFNLKLSVRFGKAIATSAVASNVVFTWDCELTKRIGVLFGSIVYVICKMRIWEYLCTSDKTRLGAPLAPWAILDGGRRLFFSLTAAWLGDYRLHWPHHQLPLLFQHQRQGAC